MARCCCGLVSRNTSSYLAAVCSIIVNILILVAHAVLLYQFYSYQNDSSKLDGSKVHVLLSKAYSIWSCITALEGIILVYGMVSVIVLIFGVKANEPNKMLPWFIFTVFMTGSLLFETIVFIFIASVDLVHSSDSARMIIGGLVCVLLNVYCCRIVWSHYIDLRLSVLLLKLDYDLRQ